MSTISDATNFNFKANIFGTTIHNVTSIVRDNYETVILFPLAVTGELLQAIGLQMEYWFYFSL